MSNAVWQIQAIRQAKDMEELKRLTDQALAPYSGFFSMLCGGLRTPAALAILTASSRRWHELRRMRKP